MNVSLPPETLSSVREPLYVTEENNQEESASLNTQDDDLEDLKGNLAQKHKEFEHTYNLVGNFPL